MDFTISNDIKNLAVRIGVPVVGCVSSAMATVYIMQEVNPLAAACICAAAILVLIAIVAPRTGLLILFFLCGYSDLLKRMLLFWSELDWDQIGYVLAVAPLVVIGLAVSVVTGWAFRALEINRRDIFLFALVGVAVAANFLMARKAGGEALTSLKQAANTGLYMALAPVALKFVTSCEQMLKLFPRIVLLFIPVAVYGIFQSLFGFADFEIQYLRSGFTTTAFELSPRPFSTLNSAGAMGDVSAIMAVLALSPLFIRRNPPPTLATRLISLLLFALFTTSCILSLVRHSLFIVLATAVGIFCFSSRRRTIAFYVTAIVTMITLILSASYILDHLVAWDPALLVESEFAERALGIQTYAERLKGFVNLTSSFDMYSPFGLPESEKMSETTYNHDPLSGMLVDYGVLVVLGVLAGTAWAIKSAHSRLLALPAGPTRQVAVMLVSLMIGVLGSHILFHGVLTTFPVNALFWIMAGFFLSLLIHRDAENPQTVPGATASGSNERPAWQPAGVAAQPVWRGRRRPSDRPPSLRT